MLIAARNGFLAGGKKWKNPYVTDGLVAMWDGEWNAGGGLHDANATVWKNLVGDARLDFDLTGMTVGDDYVRTNGIVATTEAIIPESDFTMEVVGSVVGGYFTFPPYGFFLSYGSVSNIPFGFSPTRGWATMLLMRFSGTAGQMASSSYLPSDTAADNNYYSTTRSWIATSSRAGAWAMYSNGTALSTSTWSPRNETYTPSNNNRFTIGTRLEYDGTPSSYDINYELKCVRFYNRVRDASEVAANYAVDKARFNLP